MVEAGWYQDPHNQSQLRYWDGETWTEYTHAAAPFQATQGDPAAYQTGYRPTPASGRINEVGEWFNRSFRVVFGNVGSLILLSIATTVAAILPYLAFFAGMGFGELFTNPDVFDDPDWAPDFDAALLSAAGVLFLVFILVSLVVTLAQIYILHRGHIGGKARLGEAVGVGLRRSPRLLGWTLVLALAWIAGIAGIAVVAALLGDEAWMVALLILVLIPVFIWLMVRLSMFPVAAAVAPSGTNLLSLSFRVTSGHALAIFGRMLLIYLIVAVGSWVLSFFGLLLVGIPASFAAESGGDLEFGTGQAIGFGLYFVVQLLVGFLLTLAVFSGLAGLYADLDGPTD